MKLQFKDQTLEKIYRRFKWARNNTLMLLDAAEKQHILDFIPQRTKTDQYQIQNILFQFQCLATTCNAYYRKLTGHPNQQFGILATNEKVIKKEDLDLKTIKHALKQQLHDLENLFKSYTTQQFDSNLGPIQTLSNHEHLHHGELILMFRLSGAQFPKRFQTSWAL